MEGGGGGNHIIQHGCSLGCSFIVYWKALQRILLFTVMDFSPFSFSSQIARPFCLGLHFGKMKLNEVWREFWAFVAVFSFRVATLFQPSQTPCGQSAPVTHCRAGMKPVPHTLTREWFGSIQQEFQINVYFLCMNAPPVPQMPFALQIRSLWMRACVPFK